MRNCSTSSPAETVYLSLAMLGLVNDVMSEDFSRASFRLPYMLNGNICQLNRSMQHHLI